MKSLSIAEKSPRKCTCYPFCHEQIAMESNLQHLQMLSSRRNLGCCDNSGQPKNSQRRSLIGGRQGLKRNSRHAANFGHVCKVLELARSPT